MWPIERLERHKPGSVPEVEPFALVEKGAHGLRISAVNKAAAKAGVAVGAALPDVRAASPALIVRPAETARDAEALLALAGWFGRYGLVTNVDGIDGAWVDVTGVPHLFGGEAQLCADLASRLGRLGITVRIGLADSLGAAHALARCGIGSAGQAWAIAARGDAKAALRDLPVSSLRLAPETVRLLTRLGLKRIGQLYGVPRAALAARFRKTAHKETRKAADVVAAELLLRLDQALGLVREPKPSLRPPPEALSRLAFVEPLLTAEGVEQALEQLTESLMAKLAEQGLGARRFRLALYRSDGTAAQAVVGTSRPSRDRAHVRRLMSERVAAIDAGFGIDVITLEAGRLEPMGDAQVGLEAAGGARDDDVAALVDRLSGRLGGTRVRLWAAAASHMPERADVWWPAMEAPAKDASTMHAPREKLRGEATASARGAGAMSHPGTPRPGLGHLPRRPLLLLSPPEPIAVVAEIPEGAPQHFVWRRVPRRILRSEGPERIAPEWWRHIADDGKPPGMRDYYRLEDVTGARYWVFREGLYAAEDEAADHIASDMARDTMVMDGIASDNVAGNVMIADAASLPPRWFVHGLFG